MENNQQINNEVINKMRKEEIKQNLLNKNTEKKGIAIAKMQ